MKKITLVWADKFREIVADNAGNWVKCINQFNDYANECETEITKKVNARTKAIEKALKKYRKSI